jgi:hypothetical protein
MNHVAISPGCPSGESGLPHRILVMCVNSPQAPLTPLQCSIVPVTSHCCPSEKTFITFLAFAALSVAQPCPFRKSYPDVFVVESS